MKKLIKFNRYLLLGLVILAGVSISTHATNYVWTGTTSSAWATTTNWTPNGNPGSGANDAVSIGVTAFSGSQPTLSVAPANALTSLTFGNATPSILTLSGALTVNALTLICGSTSGSDIIGASTLTLGGDVTVNDAGAGTNGALISCPVALGTATRTFTVPFDTKDSAVTNGASDTGLTISGIISGTGGIVKDGLGRMTLTAANTYTGTTTVQPGSFITPYDRFGILNIQNAQALGATSNGTFVENFARLELQGGITVGNESLSLAGEGGTNSGGALVNIGNNTWQGPVTINRPGGAATRINSGGSNLTISGSINLNGDLLILQGSSHTFPYSIVTGIISGAGTLRKDGGSGTWVIAGNNDFTANVVVMAGTLSYSTIQNIGGGTSNLGAPTNSSEGSITLAELGTLKYTGSGNTSDRPIWLAANGGSNGAKVDASGTGTLTLNGGIFNNTYGLTLTGTGIGIENGVINSAYVNKIESGTWRLSGANTYTGATTINAGTVQLGNPMALGTTDSGTLLVGGAVLDVYGTNYSNLEALTINGFGISNGGAVINSSATPGTYAGLLTLGSSSSLVGGTGTIDISNPGTITGSGYNLTLGGTAGGTLRSILGTGFATLTKVDAGAWTLSGANTFTGGATLNAGTLNINNSKALGDVAGTFTIAGTQYDKIIDNTSGGDISTLNYPLALNDDFTYLGSVPRNLNLGTGTTILSADRHITVSAGSLTLGGIINDNSISLTKAGVGTLSFGSQAVTLKNLSINTLGGTLISTSDNLSLVGNFSNNSTFTHNSGTVMFNGSSGQTIGGSSSSTFYNLSINNGAGVILNTPENVAGTLTLVNGLLNTSSANLISVTNTATGAITGGSTATFINGPVRWFLPASLGSGSDYNYPVGKGTTYLPFSLVNPTTGSGVVSALVEAFSSNSGGSADETTLESISNTEYWSLISSENFTNSSVSLTRQVAISPLNVIGGSSSASGIYSSLRGTAGVKSITASDPIGSLNRFFVMARLPYISITSISGTSFCVGSNVNVDFKYSPKGIFTGSSTFTAQLSDDSGSFGSPVTLGTVVSNVSGSQPIVGTIPLLTPAGTGYRIRVVSDTPAIIGGDNGSNIIVYAAVTVAYAGTEQSQCNNGNFSLAGNTPAVGTGIWTLQDGTASITNVNLPNSGVTGVLTGTPAVLRWTIVNGDCSSYNEVTLNNNAAPAAPTSGGDQSVCEMSPVQPLTATGTAPTGFSVVWYSTSTGVTDVTTPTLSSVGTITYYAATRNNTTQCESLTRTPVTLTILSAPAAPTSVGDQSVCETSPVQPLTATATAPTGFSVVWYSTSTGVTDVTTPTLSSVGTITYYAATRNNTTQCESLTRTPVTLTILSAPAAPTSVGDQSVCETSPVRPLTATGTAPTGFSVVWYSTSTGVTDVTTPTLSSVGTITYYAATRNNTTQCESLTRTPVTLTILSAPAAPTSVGDQSVCETSPVQPLTATATAPTGFSVVWYSTSTGVTDVTTPTLSSVGTITYYAATRNNTTQCESLTRTPVTLTILSAPAAPTSGGDQSVCETRPVQPLTATATAPTGFSVVWYSTSTGVTDVTTPTLSSVGTITYYAATRNNTTQCESLTRTPVTLTILSAPAAPTSVGDQSVCETSPVQPLTATATAPTGFSVVWYSTSTGVTDVTTPTLSSVGTITYYAATRNNTTQCESLTRTPVTLTILSAPAAPTSGGDQSVCETRPVQPLTATATAPTGFSVVWYSTSTGVTDVTTPTLSSVGTITYYAATRNNTTQCESLTRTPVTLTILSAPAAPTQSIDCSLGFGNAVITITNPVTGCEYSLDNGPFQTGILFVSVANGSHSITVRNGAGCTATGSIFQVSCGCTNGPTLLLSSTRGSICGTTPITISGNVFGGSATSVNVVITSSNSTGSITSTLTNISPFAFTYTPSASDAGSTVDITVTTDNPLGTPCAPASITYSLTVNENPVALILTGSTICASPGGNGTITSSTSVSGVSYQLYNENNVAVGSAQTGGIALGWTSLGATSYYAVGVDGNSCVSPSSIPVYISTNVTPLAPVLGTLTQPTCSSSTGSVALSGLPASGSWTVTASTGGLTLTGNGVTGTFIGLSGPATYTFTVTNAAGCTSVESYDAAIIAQPATPVVATGAITNPAVCVGNGSIVLNFINVSDGTYTITYTGGSFAGVSVTGGTATITAPAGTYTDLQIIANGCTSATGVSVSLTDPSAPTAPAAGNNGPVCSGSTLNLTASTIDGATYAWTGPNGFTSTSQNPSVAGVTTASGGSYSVTVTLNGCTSGPGTTVATVNATPLAPVLGTLTQPTCAVATGSVALSGLPATGTWTINPGAVTGTGMTMTITGLVPGTYNFTVTNAAGCISVASAAVVITPQPGTPAAPVVGAIIQPTCAVATGSVALSGLPATDTWTINPGAVTGTGMTMTITDLVPGTYNFTVTNAAGCISVASAAVVITPQPGTPAAPVVGAIIQPTCAVATGSVALSGLPATGTWTINPGAVTGTGMTMTITDLVPGTYNFTVTNAAGCISVASAAVVITPQPGTPAAPVVGAIIQPTCAVATGSVALSGLPATGTWTINPGAVTGTGATMTITGLVPGTYNFTVTNAAGCISVASAAVVITPQPGTPAAPVVGAIIQPTCAVATGSVALSGLPATGTWTINPGAVTGTGATMTITGLVPGTYNFTVTNAAGCISVASAAVVITPQPGTPAAPVVGAIIQPTCVVATGSVALSGLPATGTWTINPGAVTGTGMTTTITGLVPGTYNFTVTNAAGCTSVVPAKVEFTPKPSCVPVAVNDSITSPQDTQIKINVTNNDFDPGGIIDVTSVDIDPSTPGIQNQFTVPGQGTYTVDNSGIVTFTPVSEYCGTLTPVGYTFNGNSGATSNVATINIILVCINHPPVIDLPDVRTAGNTPVTICSPITDPDVGDTFNASICGNPQNGTVSVPTVSEDGKNVCITYTPTNNFSGQDSICVTVCDHKGLCSSSTSVIIVTLLTLAPTSTSVTCAGSSDGMIDLLVTGGTAPYTFDWSGPGSFRATTQSVSGLSGGTYLIKVTDVFGFTNSIDVTVNESSAPLNLVATPTAATRKMSVDGTVILGNTPGSINLTVTGGSEPFTFAWTGTDNFVANTENLTDLTPGSYMVVVTDNYGCSKTISTTVDLQVVLSEDENCPLIIPNVFTPNSDGVHDYFEISCLYNYSNVEIEIFNRNGNLLFKKDHYGNLDYWGSKEKAFWNGRSENNLNFMGSELPVGTYYYILKLGNGKVYTGFVFLGR